MLFLLKNSFFENHENELYPRNITQVKSSEIFRHYKEIVSGYRKMKRKLGVIYLICCYL